jgi:hypothetical protein
MKAEYKFILAFTGTCLITITLYASAFYYQFGAPVVAEWWLYNLFIAKTDIAEKITEPKIIISSGSNSLFGIDSNYIQKELGMPIVNMASHAGIPLDQLIDITESVSKPGDIIVMPLEWRYYFVNYRKFSNWIVSQTLTWNKKYYDSMSLVQKIHFISSVPPSTIMENVFAKYDKINYSKSPDRIMKKKSDVLARFYNGPREDGYTYLNINSRGDMQNTCGSHRIKMDNKFAYGLLDKNQKLDDDNIKLLKKMVNYLKDKDIGIYFTGQAMAINSTTSAKWFKQKIMDLEDHLKSELPYIGNQLDFMFPEANFYNSPYHLDCHGSVERTKRLVSFLKKAGVGRQVIATPNF